MKAFADDNTDVVEMMISLLNRVENTLVKGENAGCQHFFLFPYCFPKPSSLRSLKVGMGLDCAVKSQLRELLQQISFSN